MLWIFASCHLSKLNSQIINSSKVSFISIFTSERTKLQSLKELDLETNKS